MIGDGSDVLEQGVEMGMSLASPPCHIESEMITCLMICQSDHLIPISEGIMIDRE